MVTSYGLSCDAIIENRKENVGSLYLPLLKELTSVLNDLQEASKEWPMSATQFTNREAGHFTT